MPPDAVAVIGAGGTMGLPIARNLARAGFGVKAWNRSAARARPLEQDGVQICATAAEAVDGSDVIVTMLADADAVFASMQGEAGGLVGAGESSIWVQMSTIGERGTDRCRLLAQEHGITFVDAPVLGTKQPAEEGSLVVLASGPAEAEARLAPLFEAIGKKTIWVGAAGSGTRLKIATNSWVLTVVEGTAEMIALAQGLDLDPALIIEAIAGGPLDLPYLRIKGSAIVERDFEPSFRLALASKDAQLVVDSAKRHDLDLPLFEAISRRMAEGVAEHGEEDVCATYLTSAPAGAAA